MFESTNETRISYTCTQVYFDISLLIIEEILHVRLIWNFFTYAFVSGRLIVVIQLD